MRLSDLIRTLEELADEFDGDPQVCLAVQPSHPLAHALSNVTASRGDTDRVWLAASRGNLSDHPYAPSACWSEGIVFHDELDQEEEF